MAAAVGLAVPIHAAEHIFSLSLSRWGKSWCLDFSTAYACLIALPIYFSPCRFLPVRSEDGNWG